MTRIDQTLSSVSAVIFGILTLNRSRISYNAYNETTTNGGVMNLFTTMRIAFDAWKQSMALANAARQGKRIETNEDGTYIIIVNS